MRTTPLQFGALIRVQPVLNDRDGSVPRLSEKEKAELIRSALAIYCNSTGSAGEDRIHIPMLDGHYIATDSENDPTCTEFFAALTKSALEHASGLKLDFEGYAKNIWTRNQAFVDDYMARHGDGKIQQGNFEIEVKAGMARRRNLVIVG